jgi:hypothetical protein
MSFRLYKRVNLGGGIHLNISKTGVGLSAGIPGARYSVHSSGRTTRTVGLPGSGLYYRKDSYAKRPGGSAARPSRTRARVPAAPVITFPKAGLFAPKEDKAFVRGCTAYMQDRFQDALGSFQRVMEFDQRGAHVSEELFAGLCLIGLGRSAQAIAPLETVIASHQPIPDPLMTKYGVGGHIEIPITAEIRATLPMSTMSAALLLAEI